MSDLTTKAAEIRAGLEGVTSVIVFGFETGSGTPGETRVYLADPVTVLAFLDERDQNLALIEQQAAELAEARASEASLTKRRDYYRERMAAAESERDELLREKERLGAGWHDISTAPKDGTLIDVWATRETTGASERYTDIRWGRRVWGSEYIGEPCWVGFDDRYSVITPTHWMPRPAPPSEALENGPAGLADARSKSPAPSSQSERIAVLEAALREKSKRVEALEGRYEDWKPVSEPPHEGQIERGVLLNFYRDADEGTWWNGTWEERRDADIWCGLVTAGLNDRARAALPQEPAALAPIGEE